MIEVRTTRSLEKPSQLRFFTFLDKHTTTTTTTPYTHIDTHTHLDTHFGVVASLSVDPLSAFLHFNFMPLACPARKLATKAEAAASTEIVGNLTPTTPTTPLHPPLPFSPPPWVTLLRHFFSLFLICWPPLAFTFPLSLSSLLAFCVIAFLWLSSGERSPKFAYLFFFLFFFWQFHLLSSDIEGIAYTPRWSGS